MGKYVKKNIKCRRTVAIEQGRFGKLEVLSFDEGRRNYLNCVCGCGKELSVNVHSLLTDGKISCGCVKPPQKNLNVGDTFSSNRHGDYKILEINSWHDVHVEFLKTGTIKVTNKDLALKGSVTDQYHPSVHGKGYLGCGEYRSRINNSKAKTPEYRAWENMMSRCYYSQTPRYPAYGGKGVTVCAEWLNFQTFAKWFVLNYRDGCDLDKDILGDGMQYNPDVCRYIPQRLNKILTTSPTKLGTRKNNLPEGVYLSRRGVYTARVGHSYYQEEFSSISKASSMYYKKKTLYVREIVDELHEEGSLCEDIYMAIKDYDAKEGHK